MMEYKLFKMTHNADLIKAELERLARESAQANKQKSSRK